MQNYDFLAIGDIVVDDFIRLEDAEAYCDLDQEHCKICLRFGDKVPFAFHEVLYAVGNSGNAAVSASRLGLKSAHSAVVGDDEYGKKCLDAQKADNVSTEYIETDPKLPTNYHYVLWYGPERTILVKHAPFERHLPKDMPAPKWIYLTSLGENTEAFHHEIAEWLNAHPETKLAFQPGTFQMKLGKEKLKDIYARANIFFCNFEEAQRILGNKETSFVKQMNSIHELGPKIVVITDGIKGAYVRDEDGTNWFMPVYPHTPVERTGAGDSFSSTFTSAISLGKSVEEALLWAPINAMSVTQEIGAQKGLLTQEEIKKYLDKAPADYKPKKI
ncbi:MAG: carbohydrate kinase family protein [Candidatus Pacebacteria bacterium]|nr:carbohydrate kinase family protein [Candidatus Paceibacterota bacterium]